MSVAQSLESVSKAISGPDASKAAAALRDARSAVRAEMASSSCGSKELLGQLDAELATWETKLDVILKEPAGRQGMAKHARHWIEKLGKQHG